MSDGLLYLIFAFILWLFLRKSSKTVKFGSDIASGSRKPISFNAEDILKEAQIIAYRVNTFKQCEALENTLKHVRENVHEAESEITLAQSKREVEVLSQAVDIAKRKPLAMLFVPTFDLDTPLKQLRKAYHLISLNQYEKVRKEIGGSDTDWLPMDFNNMLNLKKYGIDPDPELKPFLEFRKIIESDLPEGEKMWQINMLASHDQILAQKFSGAEKFSAGLQWFAKKLKDDGLPMAEELYFEGYNTPEACLEIDLDEFSKRKEVGEKTVEQLRLYQDKVRSRMGKHS